MAKFFYLSNLSLHSGFFLSISILLIHHSFALQHPLCHDDDRSSLLQFKHSFVFDKFSCKPSANYTLLSSWKAGDDCCSWDGVECDNETGRVIELDLSSSCLYGSINSSSPLFRLVHLTSLNLSSNNFNLSRIPSGIRSLSQLTHLNLSFSNFASQIPYEILELPNLVSLDLSLNPLMLQKPNLKFLVETFVGLAKLHLRSVTISSAVPHSLSNLTSLSSLLLANCSLLDECPSGIFRLPNLRILSLQYNPNLTGYLPEFDHIGSPLEELSLDDINFSGHIPLSIGNLKSLSFFSARGCGFGGLIPSSIGNLSKLNFLDLSENYFLGNIPSSFSNLFQLTYLGLSYNNFTSGTVHWLGKLINLRTLKLRETNSYGPIPSSLQNLTQLDELWIDLNKLSGQIPCWLGNFTQLTKLYLSYNELQGPIPDSIFWLPNIQAIELSSNKLSGTLKFDSFLRSKYLHDLRLSYNHLSLVSNTSINATLPKFEILGMGGCNLSQFPSFLHGQHELVALDLSQNNIERPPSVTLPWTNLNLLSLKFNKFEGPLPIPPSSISIYDVSHNKFSGDVSPLFCNLKSLSILDLSDNNLSGSLPPCFSSLGSSAIVLNLRNNSLSGAIPDNFTSGCVLKLMDFSQNKIKGKIPRSIADCSKLEILNLEENQMNDVFPSWLGILPYFRILSLRSNMLYGAIGQPSTKFEFNQLQIIDLSDNHFIGKLPMEYFRNWIAMKSVDYDHLAYMQASTNFTVGDVAATYHSFYIIRIVNKGTERAYNRILEFFVVVDFSSNEFEGEIPEIIGTLKALHLLNLSNNILTGPIPSSLGNLNDLEALDLSLNQLSGDIPVQLTLLTFLSIFNVSYNNLTGPVPRGKQFGTFQNNSFFANPGLCGLPLSKTCENKAEALPLPPSEDEDDDDSPFEFNWQIVLIGCGSGLVIGVAYGCTVDTRKYEWLVKKKYARRLRRR